MIHYTTFTPQVKIVAAHRYLFCWTWGPTPDVSLGLRILIRARPRRSLGSDRNQFSSFPWSSCPFQGFFRESSRSYQRFTTRSRSPSGLCPVVISVPFLLVCNKTSKKGKSLPDRTLYVILSLVCYQITIWTWNSPFFFLTARYKNS